MHVDEEAAGSTMNKEVFVKKTENFHEKSRNPTTIRHHQDLKLHVVICMSKTYHLV